MYLLDQVMGLAPYRRVSEGLAEAAVFAAVKGPSYRAARDRVRELAGQPVMSHEGIRQQVLKRGPRVGAEAAGCGGEGRSERMFVAADGFFAPLQGGGQQEVKMAVVHRGWAVRQPRREKSDFRLVGARHFSTLGGAEELGRRVRRFLAAVCTGRALVVACGDQAGWIRVLVRCLDRVIYQVDRFHVARAVAEAFRHLPDLWRAARRALGAGDVAGLSQAVACGLSQTPPGPQRERLAALAQTVAREGESMVDYRVRLRKAGHKVPSQWRGLGVAESHIKRYKARIGGRSWSIPGLSALLPLLDSLFDGTLATRLTGLAAELEAEPEPRRGLAAGQVPEVVGRGRLGVRQAHFPALDGSMKGLAPLFRDISHPQAL